MKGSDLLVKCLENESVERVFGIPGEENLDLMDSLISSEIEFVLTKHESSAAFMAGITGRLTRRPGVCLSTLGPGASNMVIGVAEAFQGYEPMVAMSGQVRNEKKYSPQKQYIDLVSLFRPITKDSMTVQCASRIPSVARKAFDTATAERPGPVFLEMPEDVLKAEADGRPLSAQCHNISGPEHESLEHVRTLIGTADRPIILAGQGVVRAGAAEALRDLARKLEIPVAMTWSAAGIMPFDDPLSLHSVGLRQTDFIRKAFEIADLVLLIGYDAIEFEPMFWNIGREKKVAYLGSVPLEVVPKLEPEVQIIGNLRRMLTALSNNAEQRENWALDLRGQLHEILSQLPEDTSPVKPQLIVKAIRDALGKEDIAVSDVGAHLIWMTKLYPVYKENTLLVSNGLFPMGVGVPWSIGAKLVHPDKKVVASIGDGSFMMTSNELETAKRIGTPFVSVVWNDSMYGLIKLRADIAFGRSNGVDFANPDIVKYAESFGIGGERANSAGELVELIKNALKDDALTVIDVPIDRSENSKLVPG